MAAAIHDTRRAGRRVVAVGTTTTRALESAALATGTVESGTGATDLFIHPGHEFRAIDALVTNFHLPRSSVLMPAWPAMIISVRPRSPPASIPLMSSASADLNGCFSFHSGCLSASALTLSKAKTTWV